MAYRSSTLRRASGIQGRSRVHAGRQQDRTTLPQHRRKDHSQESGAADPATSSRVASSASVVLPSLSSRLFPEETFLTGWSFSFVSLLNVLDAGPAQSELSSELI